MNIPLPHDSGWYQPATTKQFAAALTNRQKHLAVALTADRVHWVSISRNSALSLWDDCRRTGTPLRYHAGGRDCYIVVGEAGR